MAMQSAETARLWRLAARTAATGTELACCIGLPVGLGAYLDGRYGWGAGATLVGFGIGLGAAVVSLRRIMREARRALRPPPAPPG